MDEQAVTILLIQKKKQATFWKVIKTKIKSEKWNDSHPVHCVPVMLLKHA